MASAVRGRAGGRARKGRKSPGWVRFLKWSFVVSTILLLVGGIAGFGYILQKHKEAEGLFADFDSRIRADRAKPSTIYSADGVKLYEVVPERREPINDLDGEVPEFVQKAFLAAEDTRFYDRSTAIDYQALGRVVANMGAKGGGSTITMQLAKLLYSNSERTFQRKVQDASIAQVMEERMTKDQILLVYLNVAYFGEGANGLGAAADVYFGKKPSELSYAEAAMLARCVRRPSDQNPVRNYAKALENAHVVLDIMRQEGWITEAKYEAAMKTRPKIQPPQKRHAPTIRRAGYFVSSVLAELRQRGIDITGGGFTITTTLDTALQEKTEREVRQIVAEHRGDGVTTAAFVLVDRDGKILSEVGGLDYRKNSYNVVTMGGLQPGSSFKPIVYATALDKDVINEESFVENTPIKIKTGKNKYYTPKNSSRTNWGPSIPLRTAFANSVNLPAVHTILKVGPSTVVKYAEEKFGYEPGPGKPMFAGPSLALGSCQVTPLEMAQAYSVFMTGGTRVKPYAIASVVGPDGGVVYQGTPTRFNSGLKPGVAATIDRLMEAVVQNGTGKAAQSVPGARGKTGTTNNARDAWFCGYAQGLIGIGWVGNERNGRRYAMRDGVFGGTVTVEMWRGVMGDAVAKYGAKVSPADEAAKVEDAPKRRRRRDEASDENAGDGPTITTSDETNDGGSAAGGNATTDDGSNAPIPADSAPATSAPGNTGPGNTSPGNTSPASGGDGNTDSGAVVFVPKRKGSDGRKKRDPGAPTATSAAAPASSPGVPSTPNPPNSGERPKTERRKRETPPPAPKEDTVEVEICADSGALATPYCPETVTRTFARKKRPRTRCPLHRGTG